MRQHLALASADCPLILNSVPDSEGATRVDTVLSASIGEDRGTARGAAGAPGAVSPPVISVIVFVLNAVNTIEKALQSVTAGKQPFVELLVMDGGSNDGTVEIIKRYEPKITFWRSHPDGNASNAVNEGVRRATGEIVCLLPADDWIEPGGLNLVRNAFAGDPDLDVLSCGTRIVSVGESGDLRIEEEFLSPSKLDFRLENVLRHPLTAARFVRRRLFLEVGDYDSTFGSSNDLDFLIRVLRREPRSRVLPDLVYNYRCHPGSQTISGKPKAVMAMMRNNIRVAEHHLACVDLSPRDRASLLGLHGRASTRLGVMLTLRAEWSEAISVVFRALSVNPLLPMKVIVWIAHKWTGYIPR